MLSDLLLYRDMPYDLRVSTVVDWLKYGADGKLPDFITLYFSNVDNAGHEGGPNSLMVSVYQTYNIIIWVHRMTWDICD